MFRCQITNRVSEVGEKPTKLVVKTREKEYKNYDREEEKEWFSRGTEIVKELVVGKAGLEKWNSWDDQQRHAFVDKYCL